MFHPRYLRIEKEQSSTAGLQKMKFVWNFDWEELRNQYRVLGWRGTLMIYLWNKDRYIWTGPHEFDVQFFGTEFTIQKELERNMDQCYSTDGGFWFKHSFELEPIFQKRVALIVEGREIKINKKVRASVTNILTSFQFRFSSRTLLTLLNF